MDAMPTVDDRVYEDFEPQMEWTKEEDCDTLILLLPGFRKEQLSVQLPSNLTLRISGERPLGDQKYRRFKMEIWVPLNTETTEITAEFEKGTLYVRHPKAISQHMPKSEPQDQKDAHEQQAAPEVASKASHVEKPSYEKTTVQESVLDHGNKDPQKAPKKKESSSRDGKSSMVADATGELIKVLKGRYNLVVGGLSTWDLKKPKTLMKLALILVLVVVLSVKLIAMKPCGQPNCTHSTV